MRNVAGQGPKPARRLAAGIASRTSRGARPHSFPTDASMRRSSPRTFCCSCAAALAACTRSHCTASPAPCRRPSPLRGLVPAARPPQPRDDQRHIPIAHRRTNELMPAPLADAVFAATWCTPNCRTSRAGARPRAHGRVPRGIQSRADEMARMTNIVIAAAGSNNDPL